MNRKTLLTGIAIVMLGLILSQNTQAVPPLPTRIGGTVTVNGSQLTQSTDTGYTFVVTNANGSAYTPVAQDIDGLNSYNWFAIDIPTIDPNDQPGGANPGDTAIIHVYRDGIELTVTSPVNGRFTVGQQGSNSQQDIVVGEPPRISITITGPTSQETYDAIGDAIDIAGTASSGVTEVTWTNSLGGSGTCNGTTSWSANSITIYSGQNIITVTAMDASGNTAADTLTINTNSLPDPLFVSPSYVTLVANEGFIVCSISGGIPPYSVTTNDTAIVSASLNGSEITITGNIDGVAEITVSDSQLTTAQVTIIVNVTSMIRVGGSGGLENVSVSSTDYLDLCLNIETAGYMPYRWFLLTGIFDGGIPLDIFLLTETGLIPLSTALSNIYAYTFSFPGTNNSVFSVPYVRMMDLGLYQLTYGFFFADYGGSITSGNIVTIYVSF